MRAWSVPGCAVESRSLPRGSPPPACGVLRRPPSIETPRGPRASFARCLGVPSSAAGTPACCSRAVGFFSPAASECSLHEKGSRRSGIRGLPSRGEQPIGRRDGWALATGSRAVLLFICSFFLVSASRAARDTITRALADGWNLADAQGSRRRGEAVFAAVQRVAGARWDARSGRPALGGTPRLSEHRLLCELESPSGARVVETRSRVGGALFERALVVNIRVRDPPPPPHQQTDCEQEVRSAV